MSHSLDPYHLWLGIPPGEQPPTAYRLLGLRPLESDTEVIANAADRQTLHLRTFQLGEHSELSERLLNEVAAARVTLLDPAKKARYDEQLRARTERIGVTRAPAQPASSPSKPALLGIPRPVRTVPPRPMPPRRRRRLPRWIAPAVVVVVLAVALVITLYYTTAFFFRSGRESAPLELPAPPAETKVPPPSPPATPAAKPKPPIVIDSPSHRPPSSGPVGSRRKSP
jgi:hypothetical protein